MHRRAFLSATGTAGAVGGLTGCLGTIGLGDSTPNVALGQPERKFESGDVAYPAWGEQIPDVTLPAPLEAREVRLREVQRPSLLTFFYSHCQTVCPVLISTQRNIQAHAQQHGYGDAVSFFPVTFDPARDTAERLQTYADDMNVDADTGNWHFLRPASKERAKTVVQDQFGVAFQRTEPGDVDTYMYTHSALTLLVNADSFVERAYRSKSPDQDRIVSDLQTVRNA
jgi:protein SCO1/2